MICGGRGGGGGTNFANFCDTGAGNCEAICIKYGLKREGSLIYGHLTIHGWLFVFHVLHAQFGRLQHRAVRN